MTGMHLDRPTWFRSLLTMGGTGRRRHRVQLLMLGVLILSFADLVITLAFLRTTGMMEANPLAAFIIKTTQSAWALAAYKGATVLVCLLVLHRLREHRAGEFAGWCCLSILAFMCVQWHRYTTTLEAAPEVVLVQAMDEPDRWLVLD